MPKPGICEVVELISEHKRLRQVESDGRLPVLWFVARGVGFWHVGLSWVSAYYIWE